MAHLAKRGISLRQVMGKFPMSANARQVSRPTRADRRGTEHDRTYLDRLNDANAEDIPGGTLTLHPTKGYRFISDKRSRAAMHVAEIKAGMRPWP